MKRMAVGGASSPDAKRSAKGHKNLRKGRHSQEGNYYSVTICCNDKKQLLVEKKVFDVLYDSFMWFGQNDYIEPILIVVMPDHIHLIYQLCEKKSLSQIMKSFKEYTGRMIKRDANLTASVWQKQFYDHGIRINEGLDEIIKYCWLNPVRAGIVEKPDDYPFWWCKYDLTDLRSKAASAVIPMS
jgi:REP element-mobilizing transposase RayT